MIASTTHEEAPARFSPWLRQRTRWFKGWMRLVKEKKKHCIIRPLDRAVIPAAAISQQDRNSRSAA